MSEVITELNWWCDLLAESDRLARQLPNALVEEVEGSAGTHEIMRLAVFWAGLSRTSRERARGTLDRVLILLREVEERRPSQRASLRLALVADETRD